jgi:hypothetical protein
MKLEIDSYLSLDKGVFVGLVHDDYAGHIWLLEQLEKNKSIVKYFFVETNQENIDDWHKHITATVLPLRLSPRELAFKLKEVSKDNYVAFSFLYARYVLNLIVIGIDSVSETQREFLNNNRTNLDPVVAQTCLNIRMQNNPVMQNNIQAQLAKVDGKYVILGGCAHYELATLLQVPSIVLMDMTFSNMHAVELKNHFPTTRMKHDIHIHDSNTKEEAVLYNKNYFFSPSKYSKKTRPYGPYSDAYCTQDDPLTKLGMNLST